MTADASDSKGPGARRFVRVLGALEEDLEGFGITVRDVPFTPQEELADRLDGDPRFTVVTQERDASW